MTAIAVLITFVASFALGSVPWGLIISRVFYHTDIRAHGSGNIGTTNAMRTMGKKAGVAVFLLDFGKGVLSGLIGIACAHFLLPDNAAVSRDALLAFAMAGCVWGHIFSPWLNFHGGKGIAVAIGALYVTFGFVPASVELFVIFAILVLATRYVSLGSVAAAAACPFIAAFLYWGDWLTILLYLAAASTVVWAHRGNIKRLLDGTERRIGDPKEE